MLASIFACASFHTPQTVEATETTDTRAPGLYETGTTTLVKDGENDMTWDYLISSGRVAIASNKSMWRGVTVDKTLAGDLICGVVEGMQALNCAFYECSSLTSINITRWDTSSTEFMGFMFCGCSSLKYLDIGGLDFSSVVYMKGMFAGVNISELDLSCLGEAIVRSREVYDFDGIMGLIGINDVWVENYLKTTNQTEALEIYKKAMSNENIGGSLGSLETQYDSEISGKSSEEIGYIGRIYILSTCYSGDMNMDGSYISADNYINIARYMFETNIETIITPSEVETAGVCLPYCATYTAKSGSTEKTLESQFLYGYKDLSMTAGTVLVAETAEVENTGVTLDTKTIIIACAIAGACVLAIIAVVLNKVYKANKRKNRKF